MEFPLPLYQSPHTIVHAAVVSTVVVTADIVGRVDGLVFDAFVVAAVAIVAVPSLVDALSGLVAAVGAAFTAPASPGIGVAPAS